VAEPDQAPSEPGLTRRQLVAGGAALGGAALVGGSLVGAWLRSDSPSEPRVVIVGAGLAGLACAYRLHRHGISASVYEARLDRVGGRCWSSRGWADGQVGEHGGEFIDTRHKRILALAKQFGLEIDDLFAVPDPGSSRLWLDGGLRTRAELRPARERFLRRIAAAARRVGPYRYDTATDAARAFDQLSVKDWLDENLPDGGADSLEGRAVWALMASEFGLDADRLSALNLFYEYVEQPADADERYHVRGGNDQVVAGLVDRLPAGTVRLDAPLVALWRDGGGTCRLRIGGIAGDVAADQVVLALPFTNLRRVDLDGAGLSARKRACIDELGMGTNAKVSLQFEQRPVTYGGWNGYLTTDDPYYLTWPSSLAEPGRSGLITIYLGGRSGGSGLVVPRPHMPARRSLSDRMLGTLDRDGATRITGIADGFNGRAWVDHWAQDPWTRGSYAAFLPGQYTRFYGFAGKAEGNIHFAGEHTALANQGYLEGAVESGERCAAEVLAAVGAPATGGSESGR
jgi:monoamine oxidase